MLHLLQLHPDVLTKVYSTCANNMLVRLVRLMLVMLNDLVHTSRIAGLRFRDCFLTASAKQQFCHVCSYCQVRIRLLHWRGGVTLSLCMIYI